MNLIFCSFRYFSASSKAHNDQEEIDSDSVPDEAFYYTEIEVPLEPAKTVAQTIAAQSPNSPSPPTLSHRDMARPPHEDPEYQRQLVGNIRLVAEWTEFQGLF